MSALLLSLMIAISALTQSNREPFVDARDGQRYRIVEIGGLRWFAENLRHATPDSRCYDDLKSNCTRWGRLYGFAEAMAACPSGWRLPSDGDWMRLESAIGIPAAALTAENGRGGGAARLRVGGDTAFEALLAGYTDPHRGDAFRRGGEAAAFWSSTVAGADDVSEVAWHRDVNPARSGVWRSKVNVTYRLSVRCVSGSNTSS